MTAEFSDVRHRDAEASFVELGRLALQVGPAAARIALTVVEDRCARNVWSSDRSAAQLDAVQFGAHSGPSTDAAAGTAWVAAPLGDLIATRACPELTAAADQLGVGSVLSVGLAFYAPMLVLPRRGHRASSGSLTLYASRPDAFTQRVIDIVLSETSHFAFGLMAKARVEAAERSKQDVVEELRAALESQSVIGRAQGILMERYQISAAGAFALLQGASNGHGRTVRGLAEEVVGSTEGGQIVSDVLEREDLGSAYAWLSQLGVTFQVQAGG
ncbi:ANTAR domain-containing protein [Knoellia sp. CPCC 206453]|uniref:ANTAR domain-containing protein n=1 Tax=Knoellia pratensis TaxID=3404796 RepID=UPI00361EF4FA